MGARAVREPNPIGRGGAAGRAGAACRRRPVVSGRTGCIGFQRARRLAPPAGPARGRRRGRDI